MASRVSCVFSALGVLAWAWLSGCAAVTGLDALEICGQASCDAGGSSGESSGSSGESSGSSGRSSSGGGSSGGAHDGGFSGPDGFSLPDGFSFPDAFPFDAATPQDAAIPCGDAGLCTSGLACCLQQLPSSTTCEAPAACGGVAVECTSSSQCGVGMVCCGVNWSSSPARNAVCRSSSQCSPSSDAILCNPAGGPGECPGATCGDTFTRAGVSYSICF